MVIKRPRIRREKSFKERLAEEAAHYNDLANKTPQGPQRDLYLRRARQAETAAHVDDWLSSHGLRPPTALSGLQLRSKAE
jgi:hypothetical protein